VCGIIGYTGFREAQPVLIDCLKRLEYRGYDSVGLGILDKIIKIYKELGEIEKTIPLLKGTTGIGHTRWATHGKVTRENAHPQLDCTKTIALIHNGIVENYHQLKQQLEKKGHTFTSQTDTETIVHLIEDHYTGNLEDAVALATKKIEGSYALVAISKKEPGKLVGARKESPLVIGLGDNENFIASDIPALLKYTNRVIYLEDKQLCVLQKDSIAVFDKNKKELQKNEHIIEWNYKDAEKAGFPHFMLKEIYDQPETINQALRGRISELKHTIEFNQHVEQLLQNNLHTIQIVACGTSYYAGLIGKYLIEQLTDIPVIVELASEYRYYKQKNNSSLVITITQSGETADTLAALREAKNAGNKTLVITNVMGSTATRIADAYILTQSGPEISVAATKSFTSQMIILYLIAIKIASTTDKITSEELYNHILNLKDLPKHVRQILDHSQDIEQIAEHLKDSKSIFFIGRGINYPLSLEGALKLKEISYIHAEGFAAGEIKHGPFALLTKDTPVISIATKNITYDKVLSNIGEIKARGPQVIAIAEDDDTEITSHSDYTIRIPSNMGLTSCIPIATSLHLLAYHVADKKGCPIDKPRNLAKSVTVE
jgi:glucosamine--fructose-6-phosphate aminotransferase (isomerizing)